jgi:hypothetical protein
VKLTRGLIGAVTAALLGTALGPFLALSASATVNRAAVPPAVCKSSSPSLARDQALR